MKEKINQKKKIETLRIDHTITVPIHREILETMRDEMYYHKGNDLEVIQFCETIGGKKLIQYLFVPCDEHGE